MLSDRYDDDEELLLKISAVDPRVAALPFVSDEKKENVFNSMEMEITQIHKVFQVHLLLLLPDLPKYSKN